MANFFLNGWLPLIFETHGLTARESGIAASCYHYGGTIGGVLVSLVLRRFGFAAIAVLLLWASLAIAAIGVPVESYVTILLTVILAGFCTVGAQFGNNAAAGLLYPTAIRSRGVGWALGVGRFGSIAGPLVGGVLVGLQVPRKQLFLVAAVPMLARLLAAIGIATLSLRRVGSLELDKMADLALATPAYANRGRLSA